MSLFFSGWRGNIMSGLIQVIHLVFTWTNIVWMKWWWWWRKCYYWRWQRSRD